MAFRYNKRNTRTMRGLLTSLDIADFAMSGYAGIVLLHLRQWLALKL